MPKRIAKGIHRVISQDGPNEAQSAAHGAKLLHPLRTVLAGPEFHRLLEAAENQMVDWHQSLPVRRSEW